MIFNNKLISAEEVVTRAVVAAREWLNAQVKEEKLPPLPIQTPIFSPGSMVVKTDAAWNGTTRSAGLGWTTKKQEVSLQFKEAARLVNSPLTAEGLAMQSSVKKCMELDVQHIIFQSDSSQLIKALNSLVEPPEIYGIIADIRIICSAVVSFSFV